MCNVIKLNSHIVSAKLQSQDEFLELLVNIGVSIDTFFYSNL